MCVYSHYIVFIVHTEHQLTIITFLLLIVIIHLIAKNSSFLHKTFRTASKKVPISGWLLRRYWTKGSVLTF